MVSEGSKVLHFKRVEYDNRKIHMLCYQGTKCSISNMAQRYKENIDLKIKGLKIKHTAWKLKR